MKKWRRGKGIMFTANCEGREGWREGGREGVEEG